MQKDNNQELLTSATMELYIMEIMLVFWKSSYVGIYVAFLIKGYIFYTLH